MAEEKKYVSLAEMFDGVEPSFKQLLLAKHVVPDLQSALEQIDPADISPKVGDILSFARFVPLNKIRAVIIGQDPYPDPRHAHGLCFSTRDTVLPPSLKNIYDCLRHHGHIAPDAPTPSGMLSSWAASGVLMINMALTTKPGKSNEHKFIWAPYMNKIVTDIGALDQPIAYLLWGRDAQAVAPLLKNNGKARILMETHPSPMAQARLAESAQFKYCKHFDEANAHLRAHNLRVIDWAPGAKHVVYTDGSAAGHGAPARAGYAAYFTAGPLKSTKLTGRIGPVNSAASGEIIFPTNIRAEGFAIYNALLHVRDCKSAPVVEVVTDSQFWIDMVIKFIPKWIRDKSPLEQHKNPDLVKLLWDIVSAIRNSRGEVIFRHVYSHGKDAAISPKDKACNALVDLWAGAARNEPNFCDNVGVHNA